MAALSTWAATVLSGSVTINDASNLAVSISVRNDGERVWTAADRVHIGTAEPRDSSSPLAHPAWLSPNRAVTFLERAVPPGAVATFEFPVAMPQGPAVSALFEIVVEGACWLPNTTFSVTVRGHGASPLKVALRALQQRRGVVARTCRRAVPTRARRWLARLAG